ncbi:hypothetical protein [Acinetobacter soli]|uniref:hypothetical protein n=1 Tax=Acinetobacter soli TaxID=487316 RepID=UPI00124D7602|nr:hypothetical protein [Acinetobacter soli]
MTFGSLESETQLKNEYVKAKAAIAVAVINNACSGTGGIKALSDESKEDLIKFIKEAQSTLKD